MKIQNIFLLTFIIFFLSCEKNRTKKDIVKQIKQENTHLLVAYYDNKIEIDNNLICLKNKIPIEKYDTIIKYFFTSIKKGNSTEQTILQISDLYKINYENLVNFFYDYIIINKADSLMQFSNLE